MVRPITLVALLLAAPNAHAASDNIQTLLAKSQHPDVAQQTWCHAYISGVVDLMVFAGAEKRRGLELFSICPSAGFTYGAATQLFVNWAKGHPDARVLEADVGVASSLLEMFPCPPPPKSR